MPFLRLLVLVLLACAQSPAARGEVLNFRLLNYSSEKLDVDSFNGDDGLQIFPYGQVFDLREGDAWTLHCQSNGRGRCLVKIYAGPFIKVTAITQDACFLHHSNDVLTSLADCPCKLQ